MIHGIKVRKNEGGREIDVNGSLRTVGNKDYFCEYTNPYNRPMKTCQMQGLCKCFSHCYVYVACRLSKYKHISMLAIDSHFVF